MKPAQFPRIVLSAGNIAHYHHAALALQQANLLYQYFCTFLGLDGQEKWSQLLPQSWRKRLQSKHVEGLDRQRVSQLPLPYLTTQVLRYSGVLSEDKTNLHFGIAYDREVKQLLGEFQVFHWVQALGMESAKKAKKNRTLCVCDVRAEHIDSQEETLREEYDLLSLPYISSRVSLRERLLMEIELADYIIIGSDYAAQTFVTRGYPFERVFILPYGVNLNQFRTQSNIRINANDNLNHPFRILFAGQVIPRKGVHYLIQAFEDIKLPCSELILIGSVEPNYGTYITKNFLAKKNIKFMGPLPQGELFRYYQNCDVFVMPTLSEGSAVVIYEAMAAGLPIITTPNAGAVVRNGKEGYIVPIRDIDALKEKLVYLYEHPVERQVMGKDAKERVKEFTWERYGERLLAIYDQILKTQGY